MKKKHFILSLIILLVASFFVIGTSIVNSQIIKATTADLTSEADNIIRGTVKKIKSEWNNEETFIWSFVTINVSSTIKGKSLEEKNISVKIPGGVVGEITQRSEHQVTFKKGEDVILFLKPKIYKETEYFHVVRQFHGKFAIQEETVVEKKLNIEAFIGNIKKAMKKK